MDYVPLGRTRLQVSRFCLGTVNFGFITSEQDSHAIMDKALEVGINFFDTANIYGAKKGEGLTEQIIGRWTAQGGGRREKIVLATKVYGEMGDGPNESSLSAYHIKRACEDSLRRLQTDCIDLYQMHHIDRDAPWEEVWQAMEQLHTEGKILYVGSSNFAGWHIATANQIAAKRNFLGLVSEQCRYNLTHRSVEMEVLPACQEYGLGVIPYSPLESGLLAGKTYLAKESRRNADDFKKFREKMRSPVEKYESFCRELGQEPANVALAWLLANPAVTAPIIGPRTLEQLTSSLRALELKLDEQAQETLDGIWPGPGGPSPEAFAW